MISTIASFNWRKPAAVLAAMLWCGPLFAAGTFVTAITIKPDTLDPCGANSNISDAITLALYDPLIAFAGGRLSDGYKPMLSTKVPTKENGLISKDGLTYTFPLRQGVKFHDGSAMTAEDAAYSLIRYMMAENEFGVAGRYLEPIMGVKSVLNAEGGPAVSFAEFIKAVRAENENLVITLKKPRPPFLSILATAPFVTSRAWAVSRGEWDGLEASWLRYLNQPVGGSRIRYLANGTGPFKFEKMDAETGSLTLVRNENYWRAPASLDKLIFLPVPSESSRLAMLEGGDIDYGEFSNQSIRELRHMPNIAMDTHSGDKMLFIPFNFKIDVAGNPFTGSGRLDGKGIPSDFFADINVRKGFAYSLNYDKLLKMVFHSRGARITSPVPRPGAPTTTPYTYDSKKAEYYFKKAFGGKLWEQGFSMSIPSVEGSGSATAANEIIAKGLREINPKFVLTQQFVNPADYSRIGQMRRKAMGWGSLTSSYSDYYAVANEMIHSEGVIPKFESYSNPEADKLCAELSAENSSAQEKTLAKLDKIYNEDIPYILMFSLSEFRAFRKGIKGMHSTSLDNTFELYKLRKQ